MTTPFGLTPIDFRYFATPEFVERSTFGIALAPAPADVIRNAAAAITPTRLSNLFGCTSPPSPSGGGRHAATLDGTTVSHPPPARYPDGARPVVSRQVRGPRRRGGRS